MTKNLTRCLSPMTAAEQKTFSGMLHGMQKMMAEVRAQSVRMAHEAERSSAMAFLNC